MVSGHQFTFTRRIFIYIIIHLCHVQLSLSYVYPTKVIVISSPNICICKHKYAIAFKQFYRSTIF